MGILGSSVKAWHCAAAELLGRLIVNPDNEPFLLPSSPQVSTLHLKSCKHERYSFISPCHPPVPRV